MIISKRKQAVKVAYERGYRVVNGVILNSKSKIVIGKLIRAGKEGKFFYLNFYLKFRGKSICIAAHQLVAYQKFKELFFTPGIHVRHLDGNSLNNLDENIVLGTAKENCMDRKPQDRKEHAIKASTHIRKFKDENFLVEFLKDRASGMSYNKLKEKYGLAKSTISCLLNQADYVRECADKFGIELS
jgi:hypothetical protein